jgi:hypothetical protein
MLDCLIPPSRSLPALRLGEGKSSCEMMSRPTSSTPQASKPHPKQGHILLRSPFLIIAIIGFIVITSFSFSFQFNDVISFASISSHT